MKIMGGPFQAVFMNINDVMIFGKNDSTAKLYASSAKETGKMGEMLSKKIYHCEEKPKVVPGIILKVHEDENGHTEAAE